MADDEQPAATQYRKQALRIAPGQQAPRSIVLAGRSFPLPAPV